MEGGQDWWRQITEAIDHVEYLVLVMTAASLRSPVVRNEWRYARQRGVCVVPVKGASELDFSQLAGWMRRAHFVDPTVPEQWTRMVRTLESPCRVPRVPMMAEPPPADFVPRRELEALRSQLLDASRQEPVAITAALRGAGGYGKTTLARALCHDDDVQDAFHDGVLWVTLGEQPGDLSARVEEWIVVLSGEASKLSSLEARKSRLTELLADRSLLLVVDDVWNAAHLKPFLVEGPRCARLITTRNSDALPRGAREVPVDAMQPGEAVALIRSGLPEGEDASLTSLARRLGEWPVLLRLVNGALHNRVVRHSAPLRGSLDYVTRILDRRGLTGFDARDPEQQRAGFDARDPEQRAQAVAWTIDVSLEQLSEQERGRFRELAVFPEDVDVPIATVELLWRRTGGLDDIETEDLLQRLFGLSLLLNYDLATRHIRVHDVIRAYLRGQIGDGLVQLDRELAEAYRTGCPAGWASGRNDGYLFQYLLWHLAGAGQHAEVRSLLLDPAWIEAKLRATDVGALLEDYKGFARDQTTRVMGQALRLSAPALACDPGAFLSQLLGRIDQSAELEIGAALRRAEEAPSGNAWLRPRTRSLTPPGGPLLQTIEGHTDRVAAVAVTPDGARAVSGSWDGTLRVWELSTGRALATLEGHTDQVAAVAVTPDGARAVSGSNDGTLKVWELSTGHALATLEGHTHQVTAVAVTPDGARAVSGSNDGTLKVWELSTGHALATLEGPWLTITAVAVTPDGTRAVSGSGGMLKVWELSTGRVLATLEGHTDQVSAVAVTPDGTRAVSGSHDRTLRVWELNTGHVLATLEGHTDQVSAVAVTPDGARAVSGSWDGTLRVWELSTGRALATFEGHTDWSGRWR